MLKFSNGKGHTRSSDGNRTVGVARVFDVCHRSTCGNSTAVLLDLSLKTLRNTLFLEVERKRKRCSTYCNEIASASLEAEDLGNDDSRRSDVLQAIRRREKKKKGITIRKICVVVAAYRR